MHLWIWFRTLLEDRESPENPVEWIKLAGLQLITHPGTILASERLHNMFYWWNSVQYIFPCSSYFFFYKTSCHIILQLSALKSKSAVKDNPGRLILWVFKFYEANVIVLQRFHGMNFTKAGNKVLRDKRWICVLWSFTSWVFVTDDC